MNASAVKKEEMVEPTLDMPAIAKSCSTSSTQQSEQSSSKAPFKNSIQDLLNASQACGAYASPPYMPLPQQLQRLPRIIAPSYSQRPFPLLQSVTLPPRPAPLPNLAPTPISSPEKDKPFKCAACTTTFTRLHDLKRHAFIHEPERIHICERCKKAFSRKDALVRHCRGGPDGGFACREWIAGSTEADSTFHQGKRVDEKKGVSVAGSIVYPSQLVVPQLNKQAHQSMARIPLQLAAKTRESMVIQPVLPYIAQKRPREEERREDVKREPSMSDLHQTIYYLRQELSKRDAYIQQLEKERAILRDI